MQYAESFVKDKFLPVIALVLGLIVVVVGTVTAITSNSILISDQTVSDSILISRLSLARGGYVVIRPIAPETGDIIAVSQYLTPGKYTNVSLPLYSAFVASELTPGHYLIAELYKDKDSAININGLPVFSFETVEPLPNLLGGKTQRTFRVTYNQK